MNVEEVFFSIARDIKQRLAETDSKAEVSNVSLLFYSVCLLNDTETTYMGVSAASDHKDYPTRPVSRGCPGCSKISLLWVNPTIG